MRDRLLDQLLTPDLGYADADTGYDNALSESFDTTDSWMGTQRAVLLTIALAR